jgi:hypothetical protein
MDRFELVEREFDSLTDCVRFAQSENDGGRYLFRGERTDRHATTWPMARRVADNPRLPPRVRSDLAQIVTRLHHDVQSFLRLDSDLALGFIQHYEAPTDLLDLTDSSDVAACFAAGDEEEGWGFFALVPKSISVLGTLIDLTAHPKANRPRRQHGHVLKTSAPLDLKSREAVDVHGVRWLRFRHRDAEHAARASQLKELLDGHNDEVAGVIQLLLDDYGKWPDPTAEWLANHIAVAPFIARVVGRDEDGRVIVEADSARNAGAVFDEMTERFNNHRVWSNLTRDRRGQGGFANLRFASVWPVTK